jgi:hypothetical protein
VANFTRFGYLDSQRLYERGKALTQSEMSAGSKEPSTSYGRPVDQNEERRHECSHRTSFMDMRGFVFRAEELNPTGQ